MAVKNIDSKEQQQEKVNPFKESILPEKSNLLKELPRPRQPQLETDKPSGSKAQKEITIKIKPWKLFKGLALLLVLASVFYLGRWSTGSDSVALPDFSSFFSSEAGPSALAVGDIKANDSAAANATAETAVAAEKEPELSAESSENETDASENDTSKTPEKIVDSEYSKVTLSLDGVYKDWKGTWGKIKGIKYTLINNEAGTIKPHHFVMTVEGYTDHGEKYFDASYTTQRIKAGQTLSDESAVSGGFAYSKTQIPDGDLSKVLISLSLLDEDGELIAATAKEVDLSE